MGVVVFFSVVEGDLVDEATVLEVLDVFGDRAVKWLWFRMAIDWEVVGDSFADELVCLLCVHDVAGSGRWFE